MDAESAVVGVVCRCWMDWTQVGGKPTVAMVLARRCKSLVWKMSFIKMTSVFTDSIMAV